MDFALSPTTIHQCRINDWAEPTSATVRMSGRRRAAGHALLCRAPARQYIMPLHLLDILKAHRFLCGIPRPCGCEGTGKLVHTALSASMRQLLRGLVLARAERRRGGIGCIERRFPKRIATTDAHRSVRRRPFPWSVEARMRAIPACAGGRRIPCRNNLAPCALHLRGLWRICRIVADTQRQCKYLEVRIAGVSMKPDILLCASVQRPVQVHHEN
mmetsp:Transcript_36807/g.106157  ORF Transcript_36807/g.106157 Transcript_36807/m.106157 type:complete len:215 (-) Transcript_36807:1596-2240(-)